VILRGYIDESYDPGPQPLTFALTCTIAPSSEWLWIAWAWENCLSEKNAELTIHGRKTISRYHAADVNSFQGEFEGWSDAERIAFHQQLVRKVFARHTWGYEGCAVNLRQLAQEWPQTARDPREFAYHILLQFLMLEMGRGITRELSGSKVELFHEHCHYDGTLHSSFNRLTADPTFAYKDAFTTIAATRWQDCVALQPADLIAYENFKDVHRSRPSQKPRDRRTIFQEILTLDSFVPHLKSMNRTDIVKLRGIFEAAEKRAARLPNKSG
jgi:hypothetical protein